MVAGHVNRTELEANYQSPGQIYDDAKTEGALEVIAGQVDLNWDDYAVLKAALAAVVAGASGAHYVKSAPIAGVTGGNVYLQLADIYAQLLASVLGTIPNGSLTDAKLSAAADQILARFTIHSADNARHSNYAADAGTTDDYAVTLSPAPTAYFTGMTVRFKANTLNTGAATLNVNALGAKAIVKNFNTALATGDILANQIVEVVYDGTNFQMQSRSSINFLPMTGGTMIGDIFMSNANAYYVRETGGSNKLGLYMDASNQVNVGSASNAMIISFLTNILLNNGTTTLKLVIGSGSPEGIVTSVVGSLYLRTDGAATTTLYVKTSGTGNTGWTAK